MDYVTRFREGGLEAKRLGMFRIEMSSGSSGTVDSIDVDGVELLDPDGGGADVITYATSLANTAKLVADKINAGTALHGFWARTGIVSSLSEVFVYQSVPGAITGAVTLGATTLVVDHKSPAGTTDNTVYGDTSSWVDLPLAAPLASDDYGAVWVVRMKAGLTRKPEKVLWLNETNLVLWEANVTTDNKPTIENGLLSVQKAVGIPLTANVPVELPIKNWSPAVTERVLGTALVAGLFGPRYALLTR